MKENGQFLRNSFPERERGTGDVLRFIRWGRLEGLNAQVGIVSAFLLHCMVEKLALFLISGDLLVHIGGKLNKMLGNVID